MGCRNRLVISCVLIWILTSFTSYSISGQNGDHDTLIIAVDDDIKFININLGFDDIPVFYGEGLIYYQYTGKLGMLAPGESSELLPGIAESWTHNGNFTEWNFTIREGLILHDKTPIDAKTVEYSFYANCLAYLKKSRELPWITCNLSEAKSWFFLYMNLKDISFAHNDPEGNGRVIILKLNEPDPQIPWTFSIDTSTTIVPYGSHGDYTDSEAICIDMSDEYDRNPISAGPYKVKEWKPNESVLLERFDQWFGWNQKIKGSYGNEYAFPKMDQAFKFVKFIVLPDGADLKEEILKRDVDIILTHNYKEIDETTKETYSEIDKIRDFSIKWPRIGGRAGLMMNIQGDWPTVFGGPGNYPMTQTWFRQAISNAINREKLVLDAYQGYAYVADAIFPASILEYFPDIDTSDYYDFNQGLEEARSILDSNGYPPLGFPTEPDNRFGYGPYLNETPEEATHGHHFRMISPDCPSCNPRSESIIDDLKSVGIYVYLDILPWFEYREALIGDIPLTDYNQTCRELGIPDPDFHGPTYDFFVSGRANFFGLPHDYVIGWSNRLWYEEGCSDNSWFNYDYEVALAKIWGGLGNIEYLPYAEPPSDAPFPTPGFSCNDTRYNEACEEAGYILSKELPYIPLVHYSQLIAINDNIQNFLLDESSIGSDSAAGMVHVAYTFWKSGENQAYLDYLFILGISSSILIGIGLSLVTYVKKKK